MSALPQVGPRRVTGLHPVLTPAPTRRPNMGFKPPQDVFPQTQRVTTRVALTAAPIDAHRAKAVLGGDSGRNLGGAAVAVDAGGAVITPDLALLNRLSHKAIQ